MPVTQTARLDLTRWSDGEDPFTRAQMDDDHSKLEDRAAGFGQGTLAARPAASAAYLGFVYWGTNTGVLYYCDGSAWSSINPGTFPASSISFTPVGGVAATDVQGAIAELDSEKLATGLAVLLTGDQTVAGVKTFSSRPLLPASSPTTDNEATRKKYVDDEIDAALAGVSVTVAALDKWKIGA